MFATGKKYEKQDLVKLTGITVDFLNFWHGKNNVFTHVSA